MLNEVVAPELIALVFGFVVHAARDNPEHVPRRVAGIASHRTETTTPLIISHVCRNWRAISFSTARLWTIMHITNAALGHIYLLHIWLKNSGTLPLKLVIQDEEGYSTCHAENTATVLGILARQSTRWASFKIRITRLTPPVPLFPEVAEALLRMETPLLKSLAFTFATEASQASVYVDIVKRLLTNSPELQEVHFWNDIDYRPELLSLLPSPRITLLNLVLVTLTMNSRLPIFLSQCTSLHTLSVSLDQFNFQFQPHSITSLRSLRFMNVINHEHSYKLLDSLHTPSLNRFSLHICTENPHAPDIYQAVESFWARSHCQLESFSIRDLRPEFSQRLVPMLRKPALSGLQELRIGSAVGRDILRLLTIEHVQGPDSSPCPTNDLLFPALREIHFEAVSDEGGGSSLSEMVLSRIVSASRTGSVARIMIVKARFDSTSHLQMERKFWDEHEELERIDRRFGLVSDGPRAFREELVFEDFSMVEGFRP